MDKSLKSKPAVLEYAQNFGTEAMMNFVHNNQKHLKDFIAEAAHRVRTPLAKS